MRETNIVVAIILCLTFSHQVYSESVKYVPCERSVISQNAENSLKLGKIVKPPMEMSVWLGVYPGPMATDKLGDLYVVDQANNRIIKYSVDNKPTVFALIKKGKQITRDYITAISSDGLDGLYLVDSEEYLIKHYDREGNITGTIDYANSKLMHLGLGEYKKNFQPDGLSVDGDGNIFLFSIYDKESGGVFDKNGKLIARGLSANEFGAVHMDYPSNRMVYYNGIYHAFGGPALNLLEIYDKTGAVISRCDNSGIAPVYRQGGVVTHMSKFGDIYLIDAYTLDIIRVDYWPGKEKYKLEKKSIGEVDIHYFKRKLYLDTDYLLRNENLKNLKILRELKRSDIRILRNTIFARKNYKFKDNALRAYFAETFQNYKPEDTDLVLSKIDKENIKYLIEIEKNRTIR